MHYRLRYLNLLLVVGVEYRGSLRRGLSSRCLLFAFPFVIDDIPIIIAIAFFVINEIHIIIRISSSTTAIILVIVHWSIEYSGKWVVIFT